MKEMLKSKVIILFITLFLGITIVGGNYTTKLDENIETSKKEIISLNIR